VVKKIKNEATDVASPRSSSRSSSDNKTANELQQEFVRQLLTMFGGVGKLEVEPKITIPTNQKPDKKKLN
jgi:hypothetical protein